MQIMTKVPMLINCQVQLDIEICKAKRWFVAVAWTWREISPFVLCMQSLYRYELSAELSLAVVVVDAK